jgi:hypothetical protein
VTTGPADPDGRIILDYALPPPSRWSQIKRLLINSPRYLFWFAFRRTLRAVEVFLGGWIVLAAWSISYAMATRGREFTPLVMVDSLAAAVLVVTVASLALIAARRCWVTFAVCMAAAIPIGAASGLVQVERCPHAIYFQFCGASFGVVGERCRNPQDVRPWWLRD